LSVLAQPVSAAATPGENELLHGKSGQMVSKMLQIWATKSRMIRINVRA